MKKKKITALAVTFMTLCATLASCNSDDENTVNLADYEDWRLENVDWVTRLQALKNPDGTPYYITVVPAWNPGVFVLMHYFNDRSETADNLTPLYTSTVDVIYEGYNKDDELFDSSTDVSTYGRRGIQRFACNRTIQGWGIALEQMHVGDTCEVIVPYDAGYGSTMTQVLPPYSAMRFNIRLADIYRYEAANY